MKSSSHELESLKQSVKISLASFKLFILGICYNNGKLANKQENKRGAKDRAKEMRESSKGLDYS